MNFQIQPIGHIRTPYWTMEACPRNIEAEGAICHVVLDQAYTDGLHGLAAGDRVVLLYWLDKGLLTTLKRPSRRTGEMKGIFALRTPHRPNPLGIAEVIIEEMAENGFSVRGLDCLDETPLIDIKPALVMNP